MIWGTAVGMRPSEASDQPFIHGMNADPVVRGNVVGWDWPSSLFQQERWFAGSPSGGTQRWIVVDKEERPIGLTGLWDVDWHNRNALTALKLGGAQRPRNRGLGRDAIMLLMAFAFYDVGLHRLHSTILADNEPSQRAYIGKCGWTVEGTARQHVWRHGEFRDLVHIGVLRNDFDQLPGADAYVELVTQGRFDGSTP